eukprot:2041572-Rhodomonas_salina.1
MMMRPEPTGTGDDDDDDNDALNDDLCPHRADYSMSALPEGTKEHPFPDRVYGLGFTWRRG